MLQLPVIPLVPPKPFLSITTSVSQPLGGVLSMLPLFLINGHLEKASITSGVRHMEPSSRRITASKTAYPPKERGGG